MRPTCTVFSDASWCPRTGAAGWGAWVIGGGRRGVVRGGQMRERQPSCNAAELAAACCSLYVARSLGLLVGGAAVVLQSDSTYALSTVLRGVPGTSASGEGRVLLGSSGRPLGDHARLACAWIAELLRDQEIDLYLRHVQGHQPGGGRAWVNRRCDEVARQHMTAMRRECDGAARRGRGDAAGHGAERASTQH